MLTKYFDLLTNEFFDDLTFEMLKNELAVEEGKADIEKYINISDKYCTLHRLKHLSVWT